MPANPRPNFLKACRRVTDWAICLVSSSNLLFIFVCFFFVCSLLSTESDQLGANQFQLPAKRGRVAIAAATLPIMRAGCTSGLTSPACLRLIRQSKTGQRHPCEADTEFLEGITACDRLGHLFGQFIEFVHSFPFYFL
jgi:hypothetical protein